MPSAGPCPDWARYPLGWTRMRFAWAVLKNSVSLFATSCLACSDGAVSSSASFSSEACSGFAALTPAPEGT